MEKKSYEELYNMICQSKTWQAEYAEAMREIGRMFSAKSQTYTDAQCKEVWEAIVLPDID